jgi:hypothetical protein
MVGHDQPGKRDAKGILRELTAAMPSIDADFIGCMVAKGAFGDSAEGLRKLMPVHRATLSVSVEDRQRASSDQKPAHY